MDWPVKLVTRQELAGKWPAYDRLQEPRAMSPQESIAHYRIVSKLGEGGMGEVWRATDTKLGRLVAIKILPAAFSDDADRMARFDREAKVLAPLNHPNIAAIYGLGTAAYMSPEQARGQEADKRADIWSFGVLVYEMLTAGSCLT